MLPNTSGLRHDARQGRDRLGSDCRQMELAPWVVEKLPVRMPPNRIGTLAPLPCFLAPVAGAPGSPQNGLHCAPYTHSPHPTLPPSLGEGKGGSVGRADHPLDRWQTGIPTDDRSRIPLKTGICMGVSYPLDRWNDYEGGATSSFCPLSRCPTSLDNG